jgi:hypothetical protein
MKINISRKESILRSARGTKGNISYDLIKKTMSNQSDILDFKKSFIYKNMVRLDNNGSPDIKEESK